MADIFSGFGDMFTLTSLTKSIQEGNFVPQQITNKGWFSAEPISSTTVILETDGATIGVVDVSARGSGGKIIAAENKRQGIPFVVPHLQLNSTILADTLQGVRKFGTTNMTESMGEVVNKHLSRMRRELDQTLELHFLNSIQGKYYTDQTGKAPQSLFTLLGKKQKVVTIDFTSATLDASVAFEEVNEAIEEALGKMYSGGTHIMYGAQKWKDFMANADVKDAFRGWNGSLNLIGDRRLPFEYGGCTHERYRPSSLISIAPTEAYAIPLDVPEMFKVFYAPADYIETVNQFGRPYYAKSEIIGMDKGIRLEAQVNPFVSNAMPHAVIKIN